MFKSCTVRKLRSTILMTSKPIALRRKTRLQLLQSPELPYPSPAFPNREQLPSTPYFPIVKMTIEPHPSIFFSFLPQLVFPRDLPGGLSAVERPSTKVEAVAGRDADRFGDDCGTQSLVSEFSMSFSLLFLLRRATAGTHRRENLWPFNRLFSRRNMQRRTRCFNRPIKQKIPTVFDHSRCKFNCMGCALTKNVNLVFSRWENGLELHISLHWFFFNILIIPTTFRKKLTNFSTRILNPPFQYDSMESQNI